MGIRTKFIAVLLGGLFLMVAVAAISNRVGQHLLLENAGRYSRDMAVQLIHQIGHELDAHIHALISAFYDGALEAILAESNSHFEALKERDADIARQNEIWRNAASVQPIAPFSTTLRNRLAWIEKANPGATQFTNIVLTNRYGAVIAQTLTTIDYFQADAAWWRHAKRDGVDIEAILCTEGAKSYELCIALRIDDLDGHFAGVIRARVPITALFRNAGIVQKRLESNEVEVFTRQGARLYSPSAGEPFVEVSDKPFFKKIKGPNGYFQDPTTRPVQMIAYAGSEGIESFRGLKWILALKQDEAEILAQSHMLGKNFFWGTAICVLLTLAAAWWLTEGIIKPIHQLRDAAQGVADKKFKKQVKVKGRDEIAQLARTFNRMTAVLDVTYMQLKQKIATFRIAQALLKENEQRLFQFLDAMPVGVYISDHTGAPYFVNQAALTLLGEGIASGAGPDHLPHLYIAGTNDPYPKEKMPITQALAGQSSIVDDMEIHHPERTIPIMVWSSPVFDSRGKVVFATAAFSDMSDQKEAESKLKATAQELKRSNAELEQFAYIASHDLQEPLRKVGSYMELVAERYQDQLDQDGREFIDYAVDGARRMKIMINDLLAYSRVGTRGKSFAPTDTMKVMQDVLNDLELTIQDNDARVTFDSLPKVAADETQLQQLFLNLIGNAVKYRGQDPPRIHVSVQRQKGAWRFCVQDNGIGMEERYFERIFQIFQRLHGRDRYNGTGIGLAICKKIVERHGGRLEVASTPGQGSAFSFTIPDLKEISI